MKKTFLLLSAFVLTVAAAYAQSGVTVELVPRSSDRGLSVMEAFRQRQSTRNYQTKELSAQDLSDLLWAANGINRPDGRRTAPTALNAQDIDLYVCRADGTYLYDAVAHVLKQVTTEDIRPLLEGRRPTGAPICLLIVSDVSRYPNYSADSPNLKHYQEMGIMDSGIVSQNISLFCSGIGLGTRPRASMDQEGVRKTLELTETQTAWMNHPVGYPQAE